METSLTSACIVYLSAFDCEHVVQDLAFTRQPLSGSFTNHNQTVGASIVILMSYRNFRNDMKTNKKDAPFITPRICTPSLCSVSLHKSTQTSQKCSKLHTNFRNFRRNFRGVSGISGCQITIEAPTCCWQIAKGCEQTPQHNDKSSAELNIPYTHRVRSDVIICGFESRLGRPRPSVHTRNFAITRGWH